MSRFIHQCLMTLLLLVAEAQAETVRGIRSRLEEPIAARGGVLMLPLTADRHGTHWPSTIELRLADRGTITGQVAWVHEIPDRSERRWTDDPRGLAVRAVEPTDDSSALEPFGPIGPYLLARLPMNMDEEGELRLGRQRLRPRWCDVPPHDPLLLVSPGPHRPVLARTASPDRPDPDSPFEYWRWVLLADRMEMNPPEPPGDEIERAEGLAESVGPVGMAAEHYAALWRIGFARLASQSRRIAEQCRERLTHTAIDRRQPFAAWVADPAQLGPLLGLLLDFRRSDKEVLSGSVNWLDSLPPMFWWPGSVAGDAIGLLAATSRTEPVTARLSWRNGKNPPQQVTIRPGVLNELHLFRASASENDGTHPNGSIGLFTRPEQSQQELVIEAEGHNQSLFVGPNAVIARPPGVYFHPLYAPLTLAEVQAGRQLPVQPEQTTFVHVRRLGGRWEVFFDCRRPGGEPAKPLRDFDLPAAISSYEYLRGIEAVTLLIGADEDHGGPDLWLTVPESGWMRVLRGVNDGTLRAHKRSFADRWHCRLVLPEAWVSLGQTEPVRVAFIRSHGEGRGLETGPQPIAPWRHIIPRASIDLTHWDDLPGEE